METHTTTTTAAAATSYLADTSSACEKEPGPVWGSTRPYLPGPRGSGNAEAIFIQPSEVSFCGITVLKIFLPEGATAAKQMSLAEHLGKSY